MYSMSVSFFALIVIFSQTNILEVVYYQSIDDSNKKRFESAEVITLNVPLKRSFCSKGPGKSVLHSERPTYPGSQLSEVFLLE